MYSNVHFLTFSDRNMVRKIALELDAAQRQCIGQTVDRDLVRGCLERVVSYLGFAIEGERFTSRATAWRGQARTALADLANGGTDRACFAACNLLYHEVAKAAAMPVSEEHFRVRASDDASRPAATFPCAVALDNLRSAFNVGSVFRSADGCGAERVWLTGITAGPDNPKVYKTAMGASGYVAWDRRATLGELAAEQRAAGRTVYALETVEGAERLDRVDLSFPCLILAGNEEFGLPEDTLSRADAVLEVPMYGRKNSFNVAVTVGIVLYEARRQWERVAGVAAREQAL